MRIVIALQKEAVSTSDSLKFLQVLCRNRGVHDVILSLNGEDSNMVEQVRGAFEGILPQEQIRLWYIPAVATSTSHATDVLWQHRVCDLLKEGFLASLKPDVVLTAEKLDGSDLIGVIGPIDNKGKIGNIVPIEPVLELQTRSFIEVLEELFEEKHSNNSDNNNLPLQRPKLAYLSPLPP